MRRFEQSRGGRLGGGKWANDNIEAASRQSEVSLLGFVTV